MHKRPTGKGGSAICRGYRHGCSGSADPTRRRMPRKESCQAEPRGAVLWRELVPVLRGVVHGLARNDGPHMGPIRALLAILAAGPYRESDALSLQLIGPIFFCARRRSSGGASGSTGGGACCDERSTGAPPRVASAAVRLSD